MYHHTGTFIRFARGERARLPRADVMMPLRMPDGVTLSAEFTSTAAFPYIRGPELVRWIKKWLPYGAGEDVVIRERPTGPFVVELAGAAVARPPAAARTALRQSVLRLGATRTRTRESFERWERDPRLRSAVLSVWDAVCQVDGCDLATRSSGTLASRMVDVHHVRSVSKGGADSALNLCVLCVMHHVLVHRAPTSSVRSMNAERVLIQADGVTLDVRRDTLRLMRAIGA